MIKEKLIHHNGFTLTEYEESRVAIFSNLVEGMLQIMELLRVFDIKLSDPDLLVRQLTSLSLFPHHSERGD